MVPISYTRESELQGGIPGPQSQSQRTPLSSALSTPPSHVTAAPAGLPLRAPQNLRFVHTPTPFLRQCCPPSPPKSILTIFPFTIKSEVDFCSRGPFPPQHNQCWFVCTQLDFLTESRGFFKRIIYSFI